MAKQIEHTGNAVDTIESALCAVEELTSEMTDWRDNLSNANMEHLAKFDEVSECVDVLAQADGADELREAIEVAVEGKPFVAGCAEHVVGQKCKRCGWSGQLTAARVIPKLVVVADADLGWSFSTPFNAPAAWIMDVAKFESTIYPVRRPAESRHDDSDPLNLRRVPATPPPAIDDEVLAEVAARRAQATADHAKRADVLAAWNEAHATRPPSRKPDEEEVEPVPGLAALVENVKFMQTGGKRQSRATRLSNALVALEAASDAIREACEKCIAGELTEAQRDLVDDVVAALDNLDMMRDELSNAEFPGMF